MTQPIKLWAGFICFGLVALAAVACALFAQTVAHELRASAPLFAPIWLEVLAMGAAGWTGMINSARALRDLIDGVVGK